MNRYGLSALAAAAVLLAGCSGAGTNTGPSEAPPPAADSPAREAPLRTYTSEQVAQALGGLTGSGGTRPVQVITDKDVAAQGATEAQALQRLETTPSICARYLNFSPVSYPGYTMGMAFLASEQQQSSVGAVVDAGGGHPGRMADNRAALNECRAFTLSLLGQDVPMSLVEVPVPMEAEGILGVRASGSLQGREISMLNVSGYRGSVMVSGTAVLADSSGQAAAVDELTGYAENLFAALEGPPPEEESPGAGPKA